MKNKSASAPGDQVIHVVLEEIFQASEIDPTFVAPDHQFQELGLSAQTIQTILARSAASLGLSLDYKGENPSTPRQMVDLLREMSRNLVA